LGEIQAGAQLAADRAQARLSQMSGAVRTATQQADAELRRIGTAANEALQRLGTSADATLQRLLADINRDLAEGRFSAITPDRFAELDRLLETSGLEAIDDALDRVTDPVAAVRQAVGEQDRLAAEAAARARAAVAAVAPSTPETSVADEGHPIYGFATPEDWNLARQNMA
jgi:hypothetical protein